MNPFSHRKDEYLEKIWVMRERDRHSVADLVELLDEEFDAELLQEMAEEGVVDISEQGRRVQLTEKGSERARRVIRAHRIGERLLYHVFGSNFEKGACEFEHTVTVELVDGLCTLLGHPRKCPHGNAIPDGECCRNSAKTAHNAVIRLRDMDEGQRAKVAYVDCGDNRQLYKLNGFQIRPGVEILLQQHYPCVVVECEGASIALDETLAAGVRVWAKERRHRKNEKTGSGKGKISPLRGLGMKFGWK
jgi:DtxR family Mn-dependent transcriptional regulator